MKRFKIIALISLCIFHMQSFGQMLTLDSVLARIEKDNPMLRMYQEQIDATDNYSLGAKSWMPPTFSTGPYQIPYNGFNNGMWMFTAEQMIPNPRKQKATYNYMHGMSSVEVQDKEAKKFELFSLAKQNYYEWIVLRHKSDVLTETDSLLNYIVRVARLRYNYNKEKLNNIYRAEAELYELRNMETMVLSDMKMKNVELNTLMNLDKSMVFTIDTTLNLRDYEVQLTDTSLITSSRSDLKEFDANIDNIKLQEEYEASKRLPDFGVSFSHMQSLGVVPNQFSAMGIITLPLVPWASKEYKANIKGLDNTSNAISYQKQSLLNETMGKITSLQSQIKSAKQQLANFRENIIPTYFLSYQTSMIAYEQNTEDLYIVLDGLLIYQKAKLNELDQLNTLLKLQVDFEREMEIR